MSTTRYVNSQLAARNLMSLDVQPETGVDIDTPLYSDVITGLDKERKEIPSKYLYDDRGSRLFTEICELDEYYPTQTEMELTKRHVDDIAARVGSKARLVELGAGSGRKTRMLLRHLHELATYVPVDISGEELKRCVDRLSTEFPDLEIAPVCADYTGEWSLPANGCDGRTVCYYPGSTIGNFHPDQARAFLERLEGLVGPRGALLIGVDLDKDPEIIVPAYNDSQGVTAEFTLNLLRRINRECGADFDLEAFEHEAVYQRDKCRIQTRIYSLCDQEVHFPTATFEFEEGEYMVVEYSYKYKIEDFADLTEEAGWRTRSIWTDEDRLFSLWFLES